MDRKEAAERIQEIMTIIKAQHMCKDIDGECTQEDKNTYIQRFEALRMAVEALQEQERKWIPVSERLPEKEANEYIKNYMHGIGYLYPCLLTYRSPNTERIHVVRFYYDIYTKWFVNNGEEPCEKNRCIAWRTLPEPYKAGEQE